jgi:type I restriction enzyme S subunit
VSFPAYPSYRDSGVEWLGPIPVHWAIEPLKHGYVVLGGATPRSDIPEFWDGDVPWVTPADLSRSLTLEIEDTSRTISDAGLNSCAASLVPAGSVILSTRAPIGSLGIAKRPVSTNQGCKSLVARRNGNPKFLYYVLSASTAALNVRGKGTTFLELSGDELASFRVPTPSPEEQEAIAAFLDRETARIDALIEEQQRLIALLKEKRQAVISHAVTKGLDPTAPMKDSGVEWLGEVPAHWEVRKFSRIVKIGEGQVDPRVEPFASMMLIAPNHVESETGRLIAIQSAIEQGADSGKYQVFKGDVVYSKIRPALAKAVLAPSDGLCSADMYPLRGVSGVSQRYLKWLLLCPGTTAWAILESDRVAMPKINREKLSELNVPLPPKYDQELISEFIESKSNEIDNLMETANLIIALLKERRSSLISTAVTGKIDVRSAVETYPKPEPEPA